MKSEKLQKALLFEEGTTLLLYIRIVTLSIMLFLASYNHFVYGITSESLFVGVAIFFGITAISGIYLSHFNAGQWYATIEMFFHTLLISLIIYNTGLAVSPWLVLYLPLVMAASIINDRSYGILIGMVCVTTYLLMIQNQLNTWIEISVLTKPVAIPPQGLNAQFLGLISSMVLTSVAVSYLKRHLSNKNLELSKARRDLELLSSEELALLDSVDLGILFHDRYFKLLKANECAKRILNIEDHEVHEKLLQNIIPQYQELFKQDDSHREVKIISNHETKELSLKFKLAKYKNGNQLLIFQDITEYLKAKNQVEQQNQFARLLATNNDLKNMNFDFNDHFVGETSEMKTIFDTIIKVAPSNANVLVYGESGTGKELVARAIHSSSPRKEEIFVAVNCGAIPESLIESQLFGHRKGSFTGATADFKGYFEQATSGTIFLDEIGELPVHLQTKLLRAIQTRKIRPVGSEKEIDIDVRIVAATNKNLETLIAENQFREDLYYRLNVIGIALPPLRDRKKDLPLLINFIIKKFAFSENIVIPPETLELLSNYNYPGNIRELENILEHAIVIGGSTILPEHLPASLSRAAQSSSIIAASQATETSILESAHILFDEEFSLDHHLAKIERQYLESALDESQGVKTKAAELLGMNFRSFRYRLQKFGLSQD